MKNRIFRLYEFAQHAGANPNNSEELEFDESLIDSLVELVGSEEEVEAAAKEAHDDLVSAFEKNEVEIEEEDMPEKLAIAALILKLIEMGKIGPDEAEELMSEHI